MYTCIYEYYIYMCVCACDILYNVLYILVYCFLQILTSLQSSNPPIPPSVDLRCMVPLWLLLRDPSVRGQQPTSVRPRRLQMVSDESLDRFVLFMLCLCSVSIIRFHLFHSLYIIFICSHSLSWFFMLQLLQFLPYTRPVDASTAGCPGLLCGTKKVRQVLVANW